MVVDDDLDLRALIQVYDPIGRNTAVQADFLDVIFVAEPIDVDSVAWPHDIPRKKCAFVIRWRCLGVYGTAFRRIQGDPDLIEGRQRNALPGHDPAGNIHARRQGKRDFQILVRDFDCSRRPSQAT